jgi:hypothetical protein
LICVLVTVGAGVAELAVGDGVLEGAGGAAGLIVVVLHAASPRTAVAASAVMTGFIAPPHLETTLPGLFAPTAR